ncbi:MAG: coiled-coil domain-containing protein, partial [Nanoarchaeota archaeon]
ILNNYDHLQKINFLFKQTKSTEEIQELLQLPKDYLESKKKQINNLKQKQQQNQKQVDRLNDSLREYKKMRKKYNKKQQKIKNKKEEINNLQEKIKKTGEKLLDRPWQDKYLKLINKISLPKVKKLLSKYYNYCNYDGNMRNLKDVFQYLQFWFRYKYFIYSGRKNIMENEIEKLYNELPLKVILKPEFPFVIYNKLKKIKDYSDKITDINKQIKTYKQELTKIKEKIVAKFLEKEINESSFLKNINNKKKTLLDKIKDLEQKKEDIQEQIKNYKMKLNIISGGEGVETGLEILEKQRLIKNNLNDLKQEVKVKRKKLDKLLEIINSKERTEIKNKLEQMKANLKVKRKEIKKTKERLEAYPERLYSLIEPTRIFIFQGDETAELFVYNCLNILQKIKSQELSQAEIESNSLPKSFIKHLQNWWSEYKQELNDSEDKAENKKQYNKNPFLQYSFEHNLLEIVLPEQNLNQIGTDLKKPIVYLKTRAGKVIKKEKLELYSGKENQVKTDSQNIPFPNEYDQVTLEVLYNEDKIIESNFKKEPFYFLREKKVSNYNPLNYKKSELIIRDDYTFEPEDIVIQKQKLAGNWSNYLHYHLDTGKLDYLSIFNDRDKLVELYNNKQTFAPQLIKGTLSNNFQKENAKVYEEKSPVIIFTLDKVNKLRLWQLKIIKNQNIINVNLSKNKDIIEIKDNLIQIFPDRLVRDKYGLYKVILKKRPPHQKRREFIFAVIPEIEVKFNKKIYPPQDEDNTQGQVNIKLAEDVKFNIDNAKEVVDEKPVPKESYREKSIRAQFNPELKYLTCELICVKEHNNFKLDLSLAIPILTWKIQGTNFNTDYESSVKEIWHQDVFDQEEAFLNLNLPLSINSKYSQLVLNQGEQKITVREKGTKKFNLMKFSDNIRNSERSVQNISVKIDYDKDNNKRKSFHLFDIRTKWEITDLQYEANYKAKHCQLNIKWNQLGRAYNKEIYLRDQKTKSQIYSQEIEDDIYQIRMKIDTDKIPPGKYLLEFRKKELWGRKETEFSSSDKLNTFVLSIGDKEDF